MEVVWAHGPLTARDVCDRLVGRKARAYTTIMTTLDRLYRKELLSRDKDGLAWRYQAVLAKQEFEKALADELAGRILAHGDVALSAFVDAAAKVDGALLDRLRQLIDAQAKERR